MIFIVPLNSLTVCKAQSGVIFSGREKRLGVFFFFRVVWNFSVHLGWRFLHDMIFCVSFPCFYVDWKSQVTLDAESTLFWATHDKIFSGCEWGSFSCFYLNPLLEHCELPMMLYDLLRASIIFVLLLAPWARVGLKFFFRCDLIRLWGGSWVAGPELQLLCVS